MSALRIAYTIATWSGARLVETIHSIPSGSRLEIISTRQHGWPLAKAWNYAAEQLLVNEGFDALVSINDDVVLQPNTGQLLAEALLDKQFDAEELGEWKGRMILVTGYNTKYREDIGPCWGVGAADYSCWCISRDYLREIGPFDENFTPAYFEDNDSHRRIRLAGFEAGCYAPYFHYGSTTIDTDVERKHEIQNNGRFDANLAYYERKWGGPPHHEVYPQPFNGAAA